MRLILSACVSSLLVIGAGQAQPLPDFTASLSAGTIAAISDGDFLASSYGDGRLAPEGSGLRDLLTVISIKDGKASSSAVPAPNSVTATPEILVLTPDGRTAFVVERLGQRRPGMTMVRELAPGTRLYAFDLSDKAALRLADSVEIGAFPEAVALSPDGRRLAVTSNTPEAALVQIVAYENGRFGPVSHTDLKEIGVAGSGTGPRGGVLATNIHWHPSGRILAVNINTQNRVAFLELPGEGAGPRLWGEPVETGRDPLVGRFTPDGRHYLTSNWGRDLTAPNLAGRIPTARSTISVIRLAEPGTPAAAARHSVVAGAETDASAEGIAISPDGRLVATVNMRDTAFPPEGPRFHREGTVTLLRLDPASGEIAKIADYPFEGVLPEGGAFDLTGDHFLATVFHGHAGAGPQAGPGLDVFKVVKEGGPRLERLGRIPLPHGVHHVAVSR